MIIDGHIHLSLFPQNELRPYLQEAGKLGITRFLQGGYEPKDWQRQLQLKSELGDKLVICFGLHPWHVIDTDENELDQEFETLQKNLEKAELIGEVGLDRFYKSGENDTATKQTKFFRAQLELAQKTLKPVVFHVVKSDGEALKILKDLKPKFPGLMHSFASSVETAREFRKLGFLISIGPGLLRPGFQKLKNTVEELDLADFVIESDLPHSFDGGGADFVLKVAEKLAEMKRTTLEKVLESSNRNILGLLKK